MSVVNVNNMANMNLCNEKQTLRILRLISISTDCIATYLDLEILPKVRLARLSCLGDFFVGDQSCLS